MENRSSAIPRISRANRRPGLSFFRSTVRGSLASRANTIGVSFRCRCAGVAYESASPGFARQALVYQHLQQSLITESFALGQLSRLGEIGLRQAKRDLHAALLVHVRDQGRAPGLFPSVRAAGDFFFTYCFPVGLSHQSASSLSFLNFGIPGIVLGIRFTLPALSARDNRVAGRRFRYRSSTSRGSIRARAC
jgi:hypothetical protein